MVLKHTFIAIKELNSFGIPRFINPICFKHHYVCHMMVRTIKNIVTLENNIAIIREKINEIKVNFMYGV